MGYLTPEHVAAIWRPRAGAVRLIQGGAAMRKFVLASVLATAGLVLTVVTVLADSIGPGI